jgi:hypothetical protein
MSTRDHEKVIHQGMPYYLTRDEQVQAALLCNHVKQATSNQVLVSGKCGHRVYMVGSGTIRSLLGSEWNIDDVGLPTEERVLSFLRAFAADIQADPRQRRIRFCATAPQYLRVFLDQVCGPCQLGLYVIGFDARSPQFVTDFRNALDSWHDRTRGTTHIEGIVSADDNNFLVDTRLELCKALDEGRSANELFLSALEMRDG